MTALITSAQMRATEQGAIGAGTVSGADLMERAGRGVVEALLAEWPDLAHTSRRGLVFCGPGNNGGDGFVIARLLRDRGWDVQVAAHGDPERLPPDARLNRQRWEGVAPVANLDAGLAALDRAEAPDLVVDALLGTGLSRPAEGDLARAASRLVRGGEARIVAADVPSGLCADSGRPLGPAASADLTVTFHRARPGHVLDEGPVRCGRLVVADIGLGPDGRDADRLRLAEPVCVAKRSGHKYGYGHAVVVSGASPRGGAARLAARGALRIGAGLVTVAAPADAVPDHAAQLTAIMLRAVDDAGALADLLEDARLNAICLGPGLGSGQEARALVAAALGGGERAGQADGSRRAVVLDADALTAFADDPTVLFALLHDACVLTPHGGEFARLFPDLAQALAETPRRGPAYSRLDATRDAAARAGCTVLLKGPDTVIATPDGMARIASAAYRRAAPWLATAGTGDVLAGMITGLLARGLPTLDAAATAAWLHVEAARAFGPGLIAEDLPEQLPRVFRELGL